MKYEKETTAYLENVREIKLAPNARARMRKELAAYADFHRVETGDVRGGADNRSTTYVQHPSVWSSLFGNGKTRTMYAQATLLIALMITGGGTVAAAQYALPGDLLYPVKIHVNENVRSAFAFGANAEARLQAELLAERVKEAEQLAREGEGAGAAMEEARVRIALQTELSARASANADPEVAADIAANLESVVSRSIAFLSDTENTVSHASDQVAMSEAETGMMMSATMLAGDVDLSARVDAAVTRADGLKRVIEAASGFEAAVRAELLADIDAAIEKAGEARNALAVNATAEAEASVNSADELLGEVESTLSTIGSVTIDAETGAIIDIDLSGDASTSSMINEVESSLDAVVDAAGSVELR